MLKTIFLDSLHWWQSSWQDVLHNKNKLLLVRTIKLMCQLRWLSVITTKKNLSHALYEVSREILCHGQWLFWWFSRQQSYAFFMLHTMCSMHVCITAEVSVETMTQFFFLVFSTTQTRMDEQTRSLRCNSCVLAAFSGSGLACSMRICLSLSQALWEKTINCFSIMNELTHENHCYDTWLIYLGKEYLAIHKRATLSSEGPSWYQTSSSNS